MKGAELHGQTTNQDWRPTAGERSAIHNPASSLADGQAKDTETLLTSAEASHVWSASTGRRR